MAKSTKQAIIFYSIATVISIIVEGILNYTIGFVKYETVGGVTSIYTTPAFFGFSMVAMGAFFVATLLSIRAVEHDDELFAQVKREATSNY